MMICPRNSEQGEAAASQHGKPNRKSNLLLWALLAAALIIIYRLAFDKIRTNKTLQTLKEEKGALQEDNKVLQEDNKVLQEDNKVLQEDNKVLQEDNKVLQEDNKVLQEDNKVLQEDNKVLQEDNKALSEENEALRRNISDHVSLKLDRNWEKHGDKCYYFNDRYLPWKKSRHFCKALGADLVKIDSREEQEFLVEKVENVVMDAYWESFWIGLTDSEVEGIWTWVDGSPLDSRVKFWLKEQPDSFKGYTPSGEDCVTIRGAEDLNSWNDDTCRFAYKSICEKPAGTGRSSSACG